MAEHWRKRQSQDRFFQKAKAEGFRARSAYKLESIQEKYKVVARGDLLLDLGAAPGSWSQLASRYVGNTGRVIALDLQEIAPIAGVEILRGDVRDPMIAEALRQLAGRPFDVVISDIAPSASGITLADHVRSIELTTFALAVALELLRDGGNFVAKAFEGPDFRYLFALVKRHFRQVAQFMPPATRQESRETFVVARGLRLRATLDPELGPQALLSLPSTSTTASTTALTTALTTGAEDS